MAIYHYTIIFAFFAITAIKFKNSKDSTAQGVAKVRHCESILEDSSERLFEDPYAHHMYYGSFVQTWLGGTKSRAIHDWFLKGIYDLLALRTKWIDDQIMERVSEAEQLVILGAGYDTRGFRLDLPDNFVVVEVDQPEVQSSKTKIMHSIAKTETAVASRLDIDSTNNNNNKGPTVEFLSINFNTDFIRKENLIDSTSLEMTKPTIVTLEGVTQYVPESSIATTLKQVHDLFPAGSLLLISYVPDSIYDESSKNYNKNLSRLLKIVEWKGEPWITSWNPESFALFLENDCGYKVVSDVGIAELNEQYLVPRNRALAENEKFGLERYVLASIVKS